jgi:SAM-dependent methyltransferase
LIESKAQPGRILDIGCSAGLFLDVMTDWERHGVEFPCNAADHARAKYGENIFLGTFEDYPEREQYFDCITLYDVLDHVRIPLELLEKCNRLLRPGGLLVVKVHDIGCLYARLSGSAFYAIIPPYHLFYYNQRTLSYALTSAGFQVTEGRHLAHLLLLKTIFFRLARNNSDSIFYRVYEALDKTALGNVKVKKNLHDLITMFGVKKCNWALETRVGK